MTISFIIPTYNAELYLRDCLESIYSLDLLGNRRDVIVVNDGSTDGTATFLNSFSQNHEMTIIEQPNQGLSAARNAGMDKAIGEYICYVDSDDVLCRCDISDVLHYMSESIDVIGINMLERNLKGKCYPYRRYIPSYNVIYTPKEFMKGRNLMPCAPSYLYRRDFLEKNNIRFYSGIVHEDEDFTPKVFSLAQSFVAVDVYLYERRVSPESITTTTNVAKQQKAILDWCFVLQNLYEFTSNDSYLRQCMQCKLDYLAVDILYVLIRQKHSTNFALDVFNRLKQIESFPLKWRWNVKHILFNILTRTYFYHKLLLLRKNG